ncbi:MAG: alkaline phosphatase family protein [Candidatus Marinimicrobia bacterium]|nr:alkaline phosphatase family protein [Candidatus Neomarinimicrobiota bacterium]
MDVMQVQADFIGDCAEYLHRTEDWDAMWIQYHAPDGINHDVLGWLGSEDAKKRDLADTLMRETLRVLFRMVERIRAACADENTVLAVVSDHGNMPTHKLINVFRIFEEKGWTTLLREDGGDTWAVDQRRTQALYAGSGAAVRLDPRGVPATRVRRESGRASGAGQSRGYCADSRAHSGHPTARTMRRTRHQGSEELRK